ncbi:glycosyl hydrolase family 18 protein [soil metagenome]
MNINYFLIFLATILLAACTSNQSLNDVPKAPASSFKVIGYYGSWGPRASDLDLTGLTHINYSFAIPAKEGNGLEPLSQGEKLKELLDIAHQNGQKVFIAIGGWSIGDGGGDDTRFHRIAETEKGREEFSQAIMKLVEEYNLDGVDMDWEYPDAGESSDHFAALMESLANELHSRGKELSAAVISYNSRVGAGIKEEVFATADWINIMAYDDNYNKPEPAPHSPYSLAEKSLNYWIKERGLPVEKAVLGLPFYGRSEYTGYNKLTEDGADPFKDEHNGIFYNGIETIKAKTRLAHEQGIAGVMIWEITQDVKGEFSLTRAINEAIPE